MRPTEIRGPYRPIATAVPGMRISELHTRLATLTQHFSLIRSMTHVGNISNHFDAMHHCLSGQAGAPADAPYIGSILSKVRPSQRNVATYVWLIKLRRRSRLLRPEHRHRRPPGLAATPRCSSARRPTTRPCPASGLRTSCFAADPPERMQDAAALLDGLNPASRQHERQSQAPRDWQDLHGRAFELATGPGGRQVFELEREPAAVRERYGMHPLGQNLLLARRLVEAGVGFVTVNGWTGPSPAKSWRRTAQLRAGTCTAATWAWATPSATAPTAWAGACLVSMRHCPRCSSISTSAACWSEPWWWSIGEFGRTPRIKRSGESPGRQHWPACYLRHPRRLRHSRRRGLRRIRQDRRLREGQAGAPAGPGRHDLPRPGRARSIFAWARTASPGPSPRASRSWICLDDAGASGNRARWIRRPAGPNRSHSTRRWFVI